MDYRDRIQALAECLKGIGLAEEASTTLGLVKLSGDPDADGCGNNPTPYAIQDGDSISRISAETTTPQEWIIDCNTKDGKEPRLWPGDIIYIPSPPERKNTSIAPSTKLYAFLSEEGGQQADMKKKCSANKDIWDGEEYAGGCGVPYFCTYSDGSRDTIGWGHVQGVLDDGMSQGKNYQIDFGKCAELLDADLEEATRRLRSSTAIDTNESLLMPIQLSTYQADALISVIFNAGYTGYKSSDLHKNFISKNKIHDGNGDVVKGFKEAFLSVASGKQDGIRPRRQRELNIFLNNDYAGKC